MSAPIDFWFSIGSTYTYLTVMRLDDVARRAGVAFRWRPFDVRAIMVAMDNIPFSKKPIKAQYMWRDVERRAAMYGIARSGVPHYPLQDLPLANRVALVGMREGWGTDYVRAAYRRWFDGREDISIEPGRSEILRAVGQDPQRVLALAAAAETESALQADTDEAAALGVFGSPTFAVGKELFWGDDRLGDAIAWHREGRLRQA